MRSRSRSEDGMSGQYFDDPLDEEQHDDHAASNTAATESTPAEVRLDDFEVLESFLQEASEHLEVVEEKIVTLERDYSPAVVDEVFRSMHTIKGTSAFFGDNPIAVLSHALEALLDGCRDGRIEMTGDLADVLLAGADELSRMVGDLSSAFLTRANDELPLVVKLDPGRTDELIAEISRLEAGDDRPADVDPREAPGADELYESFATESADLLSEAESDILALERDPSNGGLVDRAFRHIHTIKGNAGFLGLGRVEELCSQIEEVLDVVRTGERTVSAGVVTAVLRSVDSLKRLVHDPASARSEAHRSASPGVTDEYKPLGEILVEMGLADETTVERALDSQERKLGEILVSEGALSEDQVERALDEQRKVGNAGSPGDATTAERKVIRVDVAKLDRLFELVGELIMAEAMVVSSPDLEGLELERFDRSASYLGKITRQMQEIAMSVRMIPLDGLFNKMRRLVRDLSRKTGKPVEIHITGQDTEMDRNVIEVLSDPLVHMIRNCVDHGIESQAEREAAGKDRDGHIQLGAGYEGSEIWITIRDDGRGLSREAILAKAARRGLTTEEDAVTLTDAQVWDFLFQPGFSTKEQVSDVSGRGVGMDVVKRNIEQLRGKIDIATMPGSWTEVTLKIPLTLAIIDGVTTRVGNTLYALPLGDIREFQRATDDHIQTTKASGEMLELREEIIPIIRLRNFFGLNPAAGAEHDEHGQAVFIVVQSGNGRAALVVDEVIGYHQIVVKALPEYLGTMKGVSGCTVLGSGDVSLIVDTSSLIKERRELVG
ncbi:MAG: chemotaxis protein CheA [Spirochaetota bacterium]